MGPTPSYPLAGGCDCKQIRYQLVSAPLVVHCCHCRWCQRESGAAFALNAMIEAERVSLLAGQPEVVNTPSESGKGQKISRCPDCKVALWSNYAGGGDHVRFVRVGTLDQPDLLPPDIHIFIASKQPWVVLPPGMPAVPEYYDAKDIWSAEALERRTTLRARMAAAQQQTQAPTGPGPATPTALPHNRSIPEATAIPELAYPDVKEAVAWLCRAFGLRERLRIGDHRVQLLYGSGAMVAIDRWQGDAAAGANHGMLLRVADAHAHHAQALQAGARILQPPTDYPFGERQYTAQDLAGHRWTFTQSIADVDPASWGGELVA
jgi:uncharacterized glyoxalase superfamily protein PhnB